MNLTWLYKERKKERRVTEEEERKQKDKEKKIPTVGNGVRALALEIQTGNCSKLITVQPPLQPFCCVRAIEPKTTKPH